LAGEILQVINGYLGDRGLFLRQVTVVDATNIHAPSSTKNKDGKRDPETHQTKKGNQYFFGMKAYIGVDAETGLVGWWRGGHGGECSGRSSGRSITARRRNLRLWRRWLHRSPVKMAAYFRPSLDSPQVPIDESKNFLRKKL
jgi:hypothetical protein